MNVNFLIMLKAADKNDGIQVFTSTELGVYIQFIIYLHSFGNPFIVLTYNPEFII